MASLRELQRSFAAALRDSAMACPVLPPANLSIYRNNARIGFRQALERTFPVVHRRVGDEYFRQLAAHYRELFPSRSGDLFWVGRDFAAFLDEYLRGDYAWLADLARLEWSRAECSVAAEAPVIGADALAGFAPGELEHLAFGLQPALRLLSSSYPVFTVWEANQAENAPPVDQSLGSEVGIVHPRDGLPEVRRLEPRLFSFLSALHAGQTLGQAMTSAGLEADALTHALAFLFQSSLVSSLTVGEGTAEGSLPAQ
jgi:putative DNA-binding protein